jgi:hypothetical protein
MSNSELYTTSEETKKEKPAKVSEKKTAEPTLLEQLSAAVRRKIERPQVLLAVPERPNIKLIISPNISQNQVRNWRKSAGEDSKNGMDALRFACLVVGSTTVGMLFNDEEVKDPDGNELTFASDLILEMTETTRPQPDCVRAFFGVDPHVESAAVAILEAAGYSDTVATEDPTKGSLTI